LRVERKVKGIGYRGIVDCRIEQDHEKFVSHDHGYRKSLYMF
jgi:hypothetical protein